MILRRSLWASLIVVAFSLSSVLAQQETTKSTAAGAPGKAKDSYGRVDVAEVIVKEMKANRFALELNWDNDQKLAALTFPLKVTGKSFRMHYDSVSWAGRAEYFSVKSAVPKDSTQEILVGYLYDLGQGNPPLPEGNGKIGTLFFTAEGAKAAAAVCDVIVDTVYINPSNVLYGVTPDATGEVHPKYVVKRVSSSGTPVECK